MPALGTDTRWAPGDPDKPQHPPEKAPITAWNCGNVVAVLCAATEYLMRYELPRRRFQPVFGTLEYVDEGGRIQTAIPDLHAWYEVRGMENPREIINTRVDPTADQATCWEGIKLPPLVIATDPDLSRSGLIYKGYTTFENTQEYVKYMTPYHDNFMERLNRTGRLLVEAGICPQEVWQPDYVPRPSRRSAIRIGTPPRSLGQSALSGVIG